MIYPVCRTGVSTRRTATATQMTTSTTGKRRGRTRTAACTFLWNCTPDIWCHIRCTYSIRIALCYVSQWDFWNQFLFQISKYLKLDSTKEEPSLKSPFLTCQPVKINPNVKYCFLIGRLLNLDPSMGASLSYVSKGTGWVGSEKWQFLLTISTIYADVG